LIDVTKGIYVLIVAVNKSIQVKVGALGKLSFKRGLYAYVGSAQTNLEKRIERHLKKRKQKFWHIDYLLDHESVRVTRVFHEEASKPDECRIARFLGEKGMPVKGFGSSDCTCRAHLVKLKDCEFLKEFKHEVRL
jgi:Uri superfamily endonuclease